MVSAKAAEGGFNNFDSCVFDNTRFYHAASYIEQAERGKKKQDEDVWAINWSDDENRVKWSDLPNSQKVKSILVSLFKICVVVGCLYLFVCSISLLGNAFQVLAGKAAGEIFTNDSFISNPISGFVVGVLVTVLIQSSSTSTSIVVSMVASGILEVYQAVYIIMGANVGTSVTNTIVSLSQSLDKNEFRRAFAGATLLDIFNLLSVLVFLPLEIASGYLEVVTSAIVTSFGLTGGVNAPDMLKVITEPLVKSIIHVNKSVIADIAQGKDMPPETSMINIYCSEKDVIVNVSERINVTINATDEPGTQVVEQNVTMEEVISIGDEKCKSPQDFLFANTGLSDVEVGVILLIMSLVILCSCLVLMVKVLNSMMHGGVSVIIKKVINTNFKYPFGWVTGYLAMIVGAALTFVFQSSSVFTSALTPLVGIGVLSLKRMYPLTLGANIGTTTTGILSALASDGAGLANSLQVALIHLFFNISGIILWYPIPFMRLPIRAAKFLGNTTAEYRWFAVLYLITVFFVIPAILLALSYAHEWALRSVVIVVLVIVIFIIAVNLLQTHRPQWLPKTLRTWKFLPVWMRSLQPYDKFFTKYLLCTCCCKGAVEAMNEKDNDITPDSSVLEDVSVSEGRDNKAYEVGDEEKDSTKL